MIQLHISERDALIGLSTTEPLMRLKTTDPLVEVSTPAAKLEIHQPAGVLEIDQTAYHNAQGYKNMQALTSELAQKAKDHVVQVIGQMVSEGNELSHIENRGNTMERMISQRTFSTSLDNIVLESLPPADIHYTPHEPEISIQPGQFETKLNPGTATGDLRQGTVDVSLQQNASMKIWFSQNNAGNIDIIT